MNCCHVLIVVIYNYRFCLSLICFIYFCVYFIFVICQIIVTLFVSCRMCTPTSPEYWVQSSSFFCLLLLMKKGKFSYSYSYVKCLHSLCIWISRIWPTLDNHKKKTVHPESVAMIKMFHQHHNNFWCYVCVCIHILIYVFHAMPWKCKETPYIAHARFTKSKWLLRFIYY